MEVRRVRVLLAHSYSHPYSHCVRGSCGVPYSPYPYVSPCSYLSCAVAKIITIKGEI